MNRRTLINTMAVVGSVSLAGCETLLYGKEGNEAAATAQSELSEAAAVLNSVELTVDGEIAVDSEDFEGYSPEDVTQHTESANEAIAEDDSDVSEVLSVVSSVLEETAYQYESIDGLFKAHYSYEQRIYEGDYGGAIQAANSFGDRHAEISDYSSTITENLVSLKENGYNNPVAGFSVEAWSQEQSIFVDMMDVMGPLRYGFNEQARGLSSLRRASVKKNNGDYENALEQMRRARDWFEGAMESFSVSLERGITYRRALIEDFLCLSKGYLDATRTGIDALEAYRNENESEGDDLWNQMREKVQQSSGGCN